MFIAGLSQLECYKSFGGSSLHLVDFFTNQQTEKYHDINADFIHHI